jgi:hypothetical protein
LPFTGTNGKVHSIMANTTLEPVLANGEWLAHRYDSENDAYQMRYLTREAQDSATFLTDDYLGEEHSPIVVSRREASILLRIRPSAPPPCWQKVSICRVAPWA